MAQPNHQSTPQGNEQQRHRAHSWGLVAAVAMGLTAATATTAVRHANASLPTIDIASLGELGHLVTSLTEQLQQMQSLVNISDDLLNTLGDLGDVNGMFDTLSDIDRTLGTTAHLGTRASEVGQGFGGLLPETPSQSSNGGSGSGRGDNSRLGANIQWNTPDETGGTSNAGARGADGARSTGNGRGSQERANGSDHSGGAESTNSNPSAITGDTPEPGAPTGTEPNGGADNGPSEAEDVTGWRTGRSGNDPIPEGEAATPEAMRQWAIRNFYVGPDDRRAAATDEVRAWRAVTQQGLATQAFASAAETHEAAIEEAKAANAYIEALDTSESIREDLQVLYFATQANVRSQWLANTLQATDLQLRAAQILSTAPPRLTRGETCLITGQHCAN